MCIVFYLKEMIIMLNYTKSDAIAEKTVTHYDARAKILSRLNVFVYAKQCYCSY